MRFFQLGRIAALAAGVVVVTCSSSAGAREHAQENPFRRLAEREGGAALFARQKLARALANVDSGRVVVPPKPRAPGLPRVFDLDDVTYGAARRAEEVRRDEALRLAFVPIERKSTPATFVYPIPQTKPDTQLAGWSPSVLDFVESFAGRPLPFSHGLTLARLPEKTQDRGTATFATPTTTRRAETRSSRSSGRTRTPISSGPCSHP